MDNIYWNEDRTEAALGDYGFTRPARSATSGGLVTSSGQLCGTPFYMAPEMILHQQTCLESDLWALGVSLIQMRCTPRELSVLARSQLGLGCEETRAWVETQIQTKWYPEDPSFAAQVLTLLHPDPAQRVSIYLKPN